MLGQLPCKKEELPSAYVHVRAVAMYMHVRAVAMYMHVRAVAMYHAKTHGNSVKRELPSAYVHTRQLRCTLQNTWQFG